MCVEIMTLGSMEPGGGKLAPYICENNLLSMGSVEPVDVSPALNVSKRKGTIDGQV